MAIKVSNTEVVSNTRELKNITAVDDGTVSVLNTALSEVLSTDPTRGTLTKSFASGETASIALSSALSPAPVVSVTKEVPQTGINSKGNWDVNSTASNYDIVDYAPSTSLTLTQNLSLTGIVLSNNQLSQTNSVSDFAFNDDDSKIFMAEYSGNGSTRQIIGRTALNNYGVPYGGTVDSIQFNSGGLSDFPKAFQFSPDGLKLIVLGNSDNIYRFDLDTAYDLSSYTLETDNKPLPNYPDSSAEGMAIDPSGTIIYVADRITETFYRYDLTTPWDLDTMSLNAKTYTFTQDTFIQGFKVSPDGKELLVLTNGLDRVYRMLLGTAWDISSTSPVSYNQYYDFTTYGDNPSGLGLSSDFTKLVIHMDSDSENALFDLPNAYSYLDLGTGTFSADDVAKIIEVNNGKLLLTGANGTYDVLSDVDDTSTAASGEWTLRGLEVDSSAGVKIPTSLPKISIDGKTSNYQAHTFDDPYFGNTTTPPFISPDGEYFLWPDPTDDVIQVFRLAKANEISANGAVWLSSWDIGTYVTDARGVYVSPDATTMFVSDSTSNRIYEYTLSNGYDTRGTPTYVRNISISASIARGLTVGNDGTRMYVVDDGANTIRQVNLINPYSLSTTSTVYNFSVAGQTASPRCVQFSDDGTQMFVGDGADVDVIQEYRLVTPWELSSASFYKEHSIGNPMPRADFFTFAANFNKIYAGIDNLIYSVDLNSNLARAGIYEPAITNSGGSIDTQYWLDINDMSADETKNAGDVFYAISTDGKTTWSVIDNANGVRNIVRNNSGTWQYNSAEGLSVTDAYDLREITGVLGTVKTTSSSGANLNLETPACISEDGMHVYYYVSNQVYQFDLTDAWDLTTASYSFVTTKPVGGSSATGGLLAVVDGGTRLFTDDNNGRLNEYSMSTPYDSSTMSFVAVHTLIGEISRPRGLYFKPDGTQVFLFDDSSYGLVSYPLSTPFDISTRGTRVSTTTITNNDGGWISNDGLSVIYVSSGTIYKRALSTAWDVSTIGSSYEWDVNHTDSLPQTVFRYTNLMFSPEGDKVFLSTYYQRGLMGFEVGTATKYTTSETWTNTTINSEVEALKEALAESEANRMNKAQLGAVTDANLFTLGDSLDLAIMPYLPYAGATPTSDGISISYDAESIIQGAVLGTDYDYDFPDSTTVRVTSNAAQNLKVRVV